MNILQRRLTNSSSSIPPRDPFSNLHRFRNFSTWLSALRFMSDAWTNFSRFFVILLLSNFFFHKKVDRDRNRRRYWSQNGPMVTTIRHINSNPNVRRQERRKSSWITPFRYKTCGLKKSFHLLQSPSATTFAYPQQCFLIVDMIILSPSQDKYDFLSSLWSLHAISTERGIHASCSSCQQLFRQLSSPWVFSFQS
jgi:hypothetical protein